jgi:hypothetical protein
MEALSVILMVVGAFAVLMGLGLLTFVIILYALIKYIDKL